MAWSAIASASRSDIRTPSDGEGDEMNTSHPRRISRRTAEQLLDGGSIRLGAIPTPLARLLDDAAAPARNSEFAREEIAVAAFKAKHLALVTDPCRGQMITSPFAKFLTTKIVAAALAVCATGGVAIAATAGGLHVPRSAFTGTAHHAAMHAAISRHVHAFSRLPGHGAPAAPAKLGSSTGQSDVHVCLSLAADVHALISGQVAATGQTLGTSSLEQALASPVTAQVLASNAAFAQLTAAARTTAGVEDLCAVALRLPSVPSAQALASLPVSVLVNLRASVAAKLPVTVIAKLPISVISQLPAMVCAKLPVSVIAQLPATVCAKLPISVIAKLPISVIAQLPATVCAKLPISVIAKLPISVIAQLPATVCAKLPITVIAQLPVSVIARLPIAVIAKLPVSVLVQLPASVQAELPASVLVTLPNGA